MASRKSTEDRIRRMARRCGSTLRKSRERDPQAVGYGRYWIVDRFGHTWPNDDGGFELEHCEVWLEGPESIIYDLADLAVRWDCAPTKVTRIVSDNGTAWKRRDDGEAEWGSCIEDFIEKSGKLEAYWTSPDGFRLYFHESEVLDFEQANPEIADGRFDDLIVRLDAQAAIEAMAAQTRFAEYLKGSR